MRDCTLRAPPQEFKLRSNPDVGSAEVVRWRCFVARAVRRSPTSLALSTCNPSTMSDLCPVYAPFFGAMVSSYCEPPHLKP